MPKRMLHPGFPFRIDLLRGCLLVLSFQSLFNLLKRKSDDLATFLGLGAFPIMDTTLTNLLMSDLIMPLPATLICPHITQPMAFRTPVAILLLIISKVAFTEGTFLLM
jgi:hypothetical protein